MPSRQTYSGKYRLKKPEKYIGDQANITYRSGWEKSTFIWCEKNPNVKKWGSEIVVLDYICATDKRVHKYYVDLFIEWIDGSKSLVEVKPDREQKAPKKPKRQTKKYITECIAFAKNTSKWQVAQAFCKKMDYKWEIWGEKKLKSRGVKIF